MMMNNNTTNNRFKTAMCKHFEQSGVCPMGMRCHFAHGKEELRENVHFQQTTHHNQNNSAHKSWTGGEEKQSGNSFKKARCKFFDLGNCKFGQNCSFAHGEQDLHSTTNSFKGSQTGSIQNQVSQKQIQELGQSLEAYHAHDSEYLEQIRNANEMTRLGNAQDAASILYAIMSRSDRTQEDIGNYAVMTYKMQVLGENLYETLSQTEEKTPQLGKFDMNVGNESSRYNSGSRPRNVASFSGFGGGFGGNWREKYLVGGGGGYQGQQKENHFSSLRF